MIDCSDWDSFCLKEPERDDYFCQIPVGVLITEPEDTDQLSNSLHLNSAMIFIILEGTIVMDKLQHFPQAMCILFGLVNALHLNYPWGMKKTFEFIQWVLHDLGQKSLSPKLQFIFYHQCYSWSCTFSYIENYPCWIVWNVLLTWFRFEIYFCYFDNSDILGEKLLGVFYCLVGFFFFSALDLCR